jgi:tRNA-modifying protein YgfZ
MQFPNPVLYDASTWGQIEVTEQDRLTFLHNQSTNGFKLLKVGDVCETTFLTSTARTIDLATAYILEDRVLLTVSPNGAEPLIKFLDRYIFFADKVTLKDVSAEITLFRILGETSGDYLASLGIELPTEGYGKVTIADTEVLLTPSSGLAIPGYSLLLAASAANAVKTALNLEPCSEAQWETLRIQQGRPMPGQELTADFNPLESGLWHTISFIKGCYIGQETIARLDTYKGVKQQLWGFDLPSSVAVGTAIFAIEDPAAKIGTVTSVADTEKGAIGLAYVRTKAGGAGTGVRIGDRETVLRDLPYLTRDKSV